MGITGQNALDIRSYLRSFIQKEVIYQCGSRAYQSYQADSSLLLHCFHFQNIIGQINVKVASIHFKHKLYAVDPPS